MTTLGAMITKIAGELGRNDLSAANGVIQTAIEDAIGFYQSHSFFFNDNDNVTFNTVVDQSAYDDDDTTIVEYTDWYDLRSVLLEEADGEVHELFEMDYVKLRGLTDTPSSSSRPTHYCRYAEKIYLYPKPDLATYEINPIGHYKVAAPATSGESGNPWMTKAWDLIKHSAKRRIYMDQLKDRGKAQDQGTLEMAALENLVNVTGKKRRTGKIKSQPF
jgi:hypothetical protein